MSSQRLNARQHSHAFAFRSRESLPKKSQMQRGYFKRQSNRIERDEAADRANFPCKKKEPFRYFTPRSRKHKYELPATKDQRDRNDVSRSGNRTDDLYHGCRSDQNPDHVLRQTNQTDLEIMQAKARKKLSLLSPDGIINLSLQGGAGPFLQFLKGDEQESSHKTEIDASNKSFGNRFEKIEYGREIVKRGNDFALNLKSSSEMELLRKNSRAVNDFDDNETRYQSSFPVQQLKQGMPEESMESKIYHLGSDCSLDEKSKHLLKSINLLGSQQSLRSSIQAEEIFNVLKQFVETASANRDERCNERSQPSPSLRQIHDKRQNTTSYLESGIEGNSESFLKFPDMHENQSPRDLDQFDKTQKTPRNFNMNPGYLPLAARTASDSSNTGYSRDAIPPLTGDRYFAFGKNPDEFSKVNVKNSQLKRSASEAFDDVRAVYDQSKSNSSHLKQRRFCEKENDFIHSEDQTSFEGNFSKNEDTRWIGLQNDKRKFEETQALGSRPGRTQNFMPEPQAVIPHGSPVKMGSACAVETMSPLSESRHFVSFSVDRDLGDSSLGHKGTHRQAMNRQDEDKSAFRRDFNWKPSAETMKTERLNIHSKHMPDGFPISGKDKDFSHSVGQTPFGVHGNIQEKRFGSMDSNEQFPYHEDRQGNREVVDRFTKSCKPVQRAKPFQNDNIEFLSIADNSASSMASGICGDEARYRTQSNIYQNAVSSHVRDIQKNSCNEYIPSKNLMIDPRQRNRTNVHLQSPGSKFLDQRYTLDLNDKKNASAQRSSCEPRFSNNKNQSSSSFGKTDCFGMSRPNSFGKQNQPFGQEFPSAAASKDDKYDYLDTEYFIGCGNDKRFTDTQAQFREFEGSASLGSSSVRSSHMPYFMQNASRVSSANNYLSSKDAHHEQKMKIANKLATLLSNSGNSEIGEDLLGQIVERTIVTASVEKNASRRELVSYPSKRR